MPKLIPRAQFEELVIQALESLPPFFLDHIDNVEVLVDAWPSRADLREAGLEPGETLLGLYYGIPLTERTSAYNLAPPDTITLYQGPIEEASGGNLATIREQVRQTVIHEIAHYFGISDERLIELGAY
jgi:predicted Zn-dependent protease with MMP-like domain